MTDLTKEEREFIYEMVSQVNVRGIGPNEIKVSILKKMDVEDEEKAST
jgi:hypothetical protein